MPIFLLYSISGSFYSLLLLLNRNGYSIEPVVTAIQILAGMAFHHMKAQCPYINFLIPFRPFSHFFLGKVKGIEFLGIVPQVDLEGPVFLGNEGQLGQHRFVALPAAGPFVHYAADFLHGQGNGMNGALPRGTAGQSRVKTFELLLLSGVLKGLEPGVNELGDAADELHRLRSAMPDFLDASFETISAYGPSAALPHYVTPAEGSSLV